MSGVAKIRDKLNVKQRMFVENLLAEPDFNVKNAAEKAGYASPATAGSKLLSNKSVADVISYEIAKRQKRMEINADRVLKELASIGFMNIQSLLKDDGTVKPLSEMEPEAAAAISNLSISYVEDNVTGSKVTNVSIEFYSKMDALGALCKHFGMLDDRINVTHGIAQDTTKLLMHMLEEIEDGPDPIIDDNVIEGIVTKSKSKKP